MDDSGRPVTKGVDKEGKPVFVMRYVGPQDAQEGSSLRIVWALPKLYITETTGPTPVAKDIYITHGTKRAYKARGVLDDVEVEDSVDPNEVLAAQNEQKAASETNESEATGISTNAEDFPAAAGGGSSNYIGGTSDGSSPHPAGADGDASESGRKRKSGESSGNHKKSRKVVVEEDF